MPADIVDFAVPEATMIRAPWSRTMLKMPFWTIFYEKCATEIFQRKGWIVDIGGGLRIDGTRGDRVNQRNKELFGKHVQEDGVRYHVTDYTDQYHPDSVEDIHRLSFADLSIDGLFCLAVLEHVYDPKKATEEIVRVLKKGGIGFLYVPFMYRYHANLTTDYRDYFRYSKDGIAYLFRDCASVEICPVRGIFESLLRFFPFHTFTPLMMLTRILDWGMVRMRKISERQTSGYFIRIVK